MLQKKTTDDNPSFCSLQIVAIFAMDKTVRLPPVNSGEHIFKEHLNIEPRFQFINPINIH